MKRFVLFAALGLAACGGAPAPASSPTTVAPAAEEPEPTTIEEAEAQVKRATAQLDSSPKAVPGAPNAATGSAPYNRQESEECRALQSLERATTALCRLAGADDARCKNATQALEQSRTRVHCP